MTAQQRGCIYLIVSVRSVSVHTVAALLLFVMNRNFDHKDVIRNNGVITSSNTF